MLHTGIHFRSLSRGEDRAADTRASERDRIGYLNGLWLTCSSLIVSGARRGERRGTRGASCV